MRLLELLGALLHPRLQGDVGVFQASVGVRQLCVHLSQLAIRLRQLIGAIVQIRFNPAQKNIEEAQFQRAHSAADEAEENHRVSGRSAELIDVLEDNQVTQVAAADVGKRQERHVGGFAGDVDDGVVAVDNISPQQ